MIAVGGWLLFTVRRAAELVVERRKPWPDLGTVSVGLYRHPDGANGAGQRLADYLLESLDTVERKPRKRGD